MTNDEVLKNTKILSKLSDEDLDSIANLDKRIEELNNDLDKIQTLRDKSMLFLNSLGLEKGRISKSQKFIKLQNESKSIFSLINDNIKLLASEIQESESINTDTINLIAKITSDTLSDKNEDKEIKDIHDKISSYKTFISTSNKTIEKNQKKIDSFFSNDYTRKYLVKYDIIKDNLDEDSDKDSSKPRLGNNNLLLISEKENKVFLPYTKFEIEDFLDQFPSKYKDWQDVVNSEFIKPLSYYQHYPVISRFREGYALVRDREGKSVFEALHYAFILMTKSELNPAIIAACKYQEDLDFYLDCLEDGDLDKFNRFEIKYEINPR